MVVSTRGHPIYLAEYPRLVETLAQLRERVSQNPKRITALILFGSVARFTPDRASDTDLLVLFEGAARYRELLDHTMAFLHDAREVEERVAGGAYDFTWPIKPIPGNATGSDLDPDFLANIACDAVLLYCREGGPLPPALTQITPFEVWVARVQALVARRHDDVAPHPRQYIRGAPGPG